MTKMERAAAAVDFVVASCAASSQASYECRFACTVRGFHGRGSGTQRTIGLVHRPRRGEEPSGSMCSMSMVADGVWKRMWRLDR